MLASFLISKTLHRLCVRLSSVKVTCPAKYGCDSRILKMSPIMQIWPNSLSVEVRGFKIWPLGTFHSNSMEV